MSDKATEWYDTHSHSTHEMKFLVSIYLGPFSVLFLVLCKRMTIAIPAFDLNEFLLVLLQCRCSWLTTRFQSRAIETRTFFSFFLLTQCISRRRLVLCSTYKHTLEENTQIFDYSELYIPGNRWERRKKWDKLDLVSLEISITLFTNAEENISIVTNAFFST